MNTKEIISALDQYNNNWRDNLDSKDDEILCHMILDLCDSVLNDIRVNYVFLNQEAEKYWNSKEIKGLFDKNTKKYISDRIEPELSLSIDLHYLNKTGINIGSILESIVNNMVLRYDPEFVNEYEKYGFDNKKDFFRLCQALANVIIAHTARTYTMKAAQREFEKLSGVKEPYSDVYAQLFERNYKDIQIQYLVSYAWSKAIQ